MMSILHLSFILILLRLLPLFHVLVLLLLLLSTLLLDPRLTAL